MQPQAVNKVSCASLGSTYTPMLQVKNVPGSNNASAGAMELAGVNVDFKGTERIDRSWISNSYAPSRGPVARDGKREVRPIIETPPARLVMQDYTLMLGESRVWLVRCARPLACLLSPTCLYAMPVKWSVRPKMPCPRRVQYGGTCGCS
jgi:hypothetical protein